MKNKLLLFILFISISGQLFAQKQITGSVVDEAGEPMPGVTVTLKGTTQGTITNLEGKYTIPDIPSDGVLVYQFLGTIPQEISVGDKVLIDVTMKAEVTELDEVVVVGYGGVKRANLTGAVVDINASEIEDIPVANLSTALEGRLPGVKVGLATGKPGANTSFQIRTTTSFGRVQEKPLFVIDGVIFDDENGGQERFDQLDPSEVASISVLKDASAAVYGTRAAGGVVLVTTKRGSEGKPKITYKASYGVASPIRIPEMLSAYEHASMLNDIYDLQGTAFPWDYYAEDELEHFKTHEYNWLDGVLQDAFQYRHTLNISGGSEKVRYFTGGSYYKETGNLEQLNVNRYSLRTNIEADVTKNVTASLGVSLDQKYKSEPYYDGEKSGHVLRDTYRQLLTAPKWVPPVIDGYPVDNDLVNWNPYGMLESGSYKNSRSNNSTMSGSLEYKAPFLKGLKFKVQYSYLQSSSHSKRYAQNYKIYDFPVTGTWRHIVVDSLPPTEGGVSEADNGNELQEGSSFSRSYQLNTSVAYARTFGKHDVNVILLYEQSENQSNRLNVRAEGAEILGQEYLWAYNQNNITTYPGASESGTLSYIGRLNYAYADKYLLEGLFRYEASERFHPDHRWGFFPALSAGWVISEENFFKDNVNFMNFLKFRASMGVSGNDGIRPWQYLYTYSANTQGAIFGDEVTNAIEARNNGVITPTITWQKSNNFNAGLDMRFLQSRINFAMDAYYRLTYDILTDRGSSIPITAGITNMPDENWGMMFAKGLEFELGYNEKLENGFGYFVKGIFSYDKHRIVRKFQNPAAEGRWNDQRLNDPSNQPGLVCLGIIRTQEELDAILEANPGLMIDGRPPEVGTLMYLDHRGDAFNEGPDGVVNGNDRTIIAEYTDPPFNYGFSLGASWKGFSMDMTFKGAFGHKVLVEKDEQVLPDAKTNVYSWWKDYWTPENPNAAYPRPYNYGFNQQHSTFWKRDGHTLRLSNLKMAYTLPGEISEQWKIPKLSVFFTTNNLWTVISPFDFKDPSVSRGYDYPMMRTYNFGVSITL